MQLDALIAPLWKVDHTQLICEFSDTINGLDLLDYLLNLL